MTDREWSEAIGIRDTVLWLALRSLGAAVVWAGATLLLAWVGSKLILPFWGVVLIAALAGALVGVIESRGLTEQAGFASLLITALAAVFAAAAIIGTTLIVEHFTVPFSGHLRFEFTGAGIAVAAGVAAWYTLTEG